MEADKAFIEAVWDVSLVCECPECHHLVDLLDDTELLTAHQLTLLQHGTRETDNLRVSCPLCGFEFNVCCVH